MSKKPLDRFFRIAVVGLSGDEKTKGSEGVGKSCLCNRFVRSHADHFYKDHISIISQIDFSGRVINNDHFLYWGEVTKTLDDNTPVTCSIVELTEFIDDQSFTPLKGHGDKDCRKRCKTVLSSAEKLMYICKDQLGDESNYERRFMPDGKFSVDGFLVVYDVSHVQNRPPSKQFSFITDLLSGPISKSKKPCVLVATKCEEPANTAYEEVKAIRDKKRVNLVETSAFENVNVDFAFLTLVNLIDKTKKLPREVPFVTGIRKQKELLDKVEEAYMALLNRSVKDYHDLWNRTKSRLANEDNYLSYLRYFGSDIAVKKFKSHTRKLREAQQQRKKHQCLETLPLALEDMLPDLASIGGRDWSSCQETLSTHPNYHSWFIKLPTGESWRLSDYIDSSDRRIAVDFLRTNAVDCENSFKAHDNRLKEALRKERMKVEFRKLLQCLSDIVLPGRQLEDTLTLLIDEESYRYLNEAERKEIYQAHQAEITEQAKKDFVELLLENIETFEDFDMDNVNAHMEAIINHKLQKEPRYKNLESLNQERRLLLMKHAAFVDNPCRQTCPFQITCMDELINQILELKVTKCQEREAFERWSEPNNKLSLVILGENGLADELANEIKAQSVQEEYTLDNVIYSLEIRPIEGDVNLPQNYITTPNFTPQGCICTFRSPEDLAYISSSLIKSQLALSEDGAESIYATLQPEIPVILLFARELYVPDSDIAQMRSDVIKLSQKLIDCTIVDMPNDESTLWHGKKFHESQIRRSISSIVKSRRCSGQDREDDLSHDGSQYEPDLRIGMAMMCGDPNLPDLVLGPIIGNDTCCRDTDLKQTVNVDMFLNSVKRRVSIEITSFHQSKLYTEDIHHGYIVVYSTKRRASFETLKFFVKSVTPIPVEIVAVSDSDKFSSDYEMQSLISEGNKLADETMNCTFITAGANFGNQSLAYSTFFTEAYDKMSETEHIHDRLFGPIFEDESYDEDRQGIRTPLEPPPTGFEEYSKARAVRGVVYPGEKQRGGGGGEENLYDQPENLTSGLVRRPPPPANHKAEESWDPIARRRCKTEGKKWSKEDIGHPTTPEGRAKRHSLRLKNRRSSSARSSDDDQGMVDNVLYGTCKSPMNGSAHYASTNLFDGQSSDMVKNPIYDSVEPSQPSHGFLPSGKPVIAPKPKPRQRQPHPRGHEDLSSDNEPGGEAIYAKPIKKGTGYDKVVHEFHEKHATRGNISSDSDSKGSSELEQPTKKKRSSFRRKKHRGGGGDPDDMSPHHPNLEEKTFSPDEEEIDTKARNRQLREEEKTRKKEEEKHKKEEKRKIAANKKRDKAQRQQQRQHQLQKSKKKKNNMAPVFAGYLDKPKGLALEELVTEDEPIPKFVRRCIEYIDVEGLTQEGIYRVSGKSADCDSITAKFEEDPNVSLESQEVSVHAVASAVKQFFKNLPDPVIPHELQGELLKMFKGKSIAEFLDSMPEFFNKLPPIRLAILRYLMRHFARVVAECEINKMVEQNLTVCWWPTLLHPQFKSLEDVANESQLSAFVEQWMKHADKLFGRDEDDVTWGAAEEEGQEEGGEVPPIEVQEKGEVAERVAEEQDCPLYAQVTRKPRLDVE